MAVAGGGDGRGRPRDAALDERILRATRELLGERGFDALSFVAVAERAGTTRAAVYRRHATPTDLAVAAIAELAAAATPRPTGEPLTDLTAELAHFRAGITAVDGLALTAAVLAGTTDPALVATYRRTVVAPRRRRLDAILLGAVRDNLIDVDEVGRGLLVSTCTGSWYAYAVAGRTPPADWPDRLARSVLHAAGWRPSGA